jgi:putative lipoprotein
MALIDRRRFAAFAFVVAGAFLPSVTAADIDRATWFANQTPAPIDLQKPAAPLSLLLVRVAEKSPPEAGSIKGTTWRLSRVGGEDAAAGVVSTLTFNDDNNISGNGGCNSFGGKASFDGAKLKIADVFSTMMACKQPKMEQEAAFLAALAKVASYTVEGGTLILLDDSGTPLATLTAAP